MEVQIVFYSMYGHIYQMAEAVARGVREVEGANVTLYQVEELVPDAALERTGAKKAREVFAHVPLADPKKLPEADAVIFGTPTRFGNMCAQMKNFLDHLGSLWAVDALVGKVGGVFTSSNTQHGGQESTILSFHFVLWHLGFILVGLPYAEKLQTGLEEIKGGSPYGASTIAGSDGSRQPSEVEKAMAAYQGRHVARITKALLAGGWQAGPM
ncbi:MAG: NAD(P)H:quinone oxidoreductase [Deltaproteobacteria bacterium]|nr:NAD(P)H:quinone oxidoreductase [Deltaproteobacteria bacterium]